MNDRDPDGFVTLHTGRPPILMRVVYLLAMATSIALFARVMDAKGQTTTIIQTPMPPTAVTGTSSGVMLSSSIRQIATCEDGWTVVMTTGGYMCARELRAPK